MSNEEVLNTVTLNNKIGKDSVSISVVKTHCIVCNSEFAKPRAGKLYCSNRCKQFGYNHKQINIPVLQPGNEQIKRTKRKFLLEDFAFYVEKYNKLKRYKELVKRNEKFKDEEKKEHVRNSLGFQRNLENAYSYHLYELDHEEIVELEILESDLNEFKNFESPNLSIEQWCFFKSLFKNLDNESLFITISQFSKEYIQMLKLTTNIENGSNVNLTINKKFIIHCNEITDGLIRFI